MVISKKIIVNTQFQALHNWETCNIPEVEYLRDFHRHLFYVTLEIKVRGSDRELEFFTVKKSLDEFILINFLDRHLKNTSCEMIAEQILDWIWPQLKSPPWARQVTVRVMEDNENGAEVSGGS